jgi:hypothetical protein
LKRDHQTIIVEAKIRSIGATYAIVTVKVRVQGQKLNLMDSEKNKAFNTWKPKDREKHHLVASQPALVAPPLTAGFDPHRLSAKNTASSSYI